MKIKLKNVRLAFPNLWEATSQNPGDKPAFSAAFILPKDHPDVTLIEKTIEQVANEKWGDKAAALLKSLKASDKTPLHDGDTKSQLDGYAGNLFVNARRYTRPTVLNTDGTPLCEQDGKPYAGCMVHAVIDIYAQDNNYGKRINASLSGIMFFRDNDAFGGGRPADVSDFADLVEGTDIEDIL